MADLDIRTMPEPEVVAAILQRLKMLDPIPSTTESESSASVSDFGSSGRLDEETKPPATNTLIMQLRRYFQNTF